MASILLSKCNDSDTSLCYTGNYPFLTLYQPMTHICVMSSHKPIRIYMWGLILGVNTLYRLFCFKLFSMVGKGLTVLWLQSVHACGFGDTVLNEEKDQSCCGGMVMLLHMASYSVAAVAIYVCACQWCRFGSCTSPRLHVQLLAEDSVDGGEPTLVH